MIRSPLPTRTFLPGIGLRVLVCFVLDCIARACIARAQALPAGTASPAYQGFQLPSTQGSLDYSFSAAERLTFNYNGAGQTASAADLSGNLALLTSGAVHPFSLVESGGALLNTAGEPSTVFENLAVSQVYNTRDLSFVVTDGVSILPETATLGLSGLAGLGDLGITPVNYPINATQGSLTNYATRLDNHAAGSVEAHLTGRTSIQGTGTYAVERFLGASGDSALESNDLTFSAGPSHRFSARRIMAADYTWSQFSYVGIDSKFTLQSVDFAVEEQMTRKLKIDLSAGPQHVSASQLTGPGPGWNFIAGARIAYTGLRDDGALEYSRETTTGSGVTLGARTDTVRFTFDRTLGSALRLAAAAGYARNAGLAAFYGASLITDSEIASVQLNRALSRTLSSYLSYSIQRQTGEGTTPALAPFNGLSQILGFGLTYAPAMHHLGH